MSSGLSYLLYFEVDRTFSVVPKRSVTKVVNISNKKFAHGGYGDRAYVGQVICEGDEQSIRKHMKEKKLTKSLAEETESERENVASNSKKKHVYFNIKAIFINFTFTTKGFSGYAGDDSDSDGDGLLKQLQATSNKSKTVFPGTG